MKKRIASMLAATVLLLSVIALPASAQTDWFGNSDLTTAKVREIADADTLTESQIAEINNHYSEYEIMQGISKTLIEDYAARINPDNPPHCAVCAGFDDLYLHYIDNVYLRLGYDGSNYDIQRGYDYTIFQGIAWGNKTFLNERKQFQAVRRFGAQHAYKSDYYNTGAMTIRLGNVIENNGVNSVYDGYILASDGTAYNVRVNAPNGYYQPGNTYDDLNPVLIKLGYTNSLGVYVEENFAYLLAPDCSYADLEELSNLANEAIGAQMKYPNDVNNMYRNTYNAYVFSGFVHLYSYYYKLNAEGGVEKWIPYEYNLYRNILVTSSSFDKAFNDTYKGFIKPQSEYPDAYTDTFYISQKLSNSTGNSILDVLNDAFSDGSSEWVGYKGGFFSYNDDACVLVTAKGMSFSESGDYSLTYVESGKTTTLTDSRGFEQEADIYYAYNTDEFSEAYENLNTVDNEIADESSLIFEFLIGNENYTDWQ